MKTTIATLSATAALLVASPAWAQTVRTGNTTYPVTERTRVILTETDAVLVGDAEPVATGQVTEITPAPQGRYVLLSRYHYENKERPVPPLLAQDELRFLNLESDYEDAGIRLAESSLLLWDSKTRRTIPLFRMPPSAPGFYSGFSEATWLANSTHALALIYDIGPAQKTDEPYPDHPIFQKLLWINAATGKARVVQDFGESSVSIKVSPRLPAALLITFITTPDKKSAQLLRLVRANGTVTEPLVLPEIHRFSFQGWNEDGTQVGFLENVPWKTKEERVENEKKARRFLVNVSTGQIAVVEAFPTPLTRSPKPETPSLPVQLVTKPATIPHAGFGDEKTDVVWLESRAVPGEKPTTSGKNKENEKRAAFLAADAKAVTLLPDMTAALYQSRGSLYAVPLARVSRADYQAAMNKVRQKQTIQRAKFIGLELLGYAADHNNALPAPANLSDIMQESHFRRDLLTGDAAKGESAFVYLLNNALPLASIEKPAQFPLGSLAGPGGQAIIYADGHVVWQDK